MLSVCQKVTRHRQDAEDATQAVFLVLAERLRAGETIRSPGAWLQQVAKRAAVDVRRSRARRRRRERERAAGEVTHTPLPSDNETVAKMIREELERVPAKYRIPLILHYFNGQNFAEAAGVLGIKPSTLGVRIFRGRKLLGDRLARRGLTLSGVALITLLATVVRRSVSEALIKSVAKIAVTGGAGAGASGGPMALGQGLAALAASSQIKVIAVGALLAAAAVGARAAVQWHPDIPSFLDPRKIVPALPNLRTNIPRLRADAEEPPKADWQLPGEENVASAEETQKSPERALGPWPTTHRSGIAPSRYGASPQMQPLPNAQSVAVAHPVRAGAPSSSPAVQQPVASNALPTALPTPPAKAGNGAPAEHVASGAPSAPGHVAAGPPASAQQPKPSPHNAPGSTNASGPRNATGSLNGGSSGGPSLNPNPPGGDQPTAPDGNTNPGASGTPRSGQGTAPGSSGAPGAPNPIVGNGRPYPDGPSILDSNSSTSVLDPNSRFNTEALSGPGTGGPHVLVPGEGGVFIPPTGSPVGGEIFPTAAGSPQVIHYSMGVAPEPGSAVLIVVGGSGLLLRRQPRRGGRP